MTTYTLDFEGGTNGSSVSASGWTVIPGSGAAITYDNTRAAHGVQSAKLVPASGIASSVYVNTLNTTTAAIRGYFYFSTITSDDEWLFKFGGAGNSTDLIGKLNSAGALRLQDTTGTKWTAASALPLNQWVRIEMRLDLGANTAQLVYYLGDSTTPVTGGDSGTISVSAGTIINYGVFGRPNNGTYTTPFWVDDVRLVDSSASLIGPVPVPPVAAFSSTPTALTVAFDATASTATSPATVSSYTWDFGDSSSGSGSGPSHTYATGGTYSVALYVTDSTGSTSSTVTHSVTVAGASYTVVPASTSVATGWTASSGTVLSCLQDTDQTTLITSPAGPTNQELTVVLGALVPPTTGNPLRILINIDTLSAASGSFNAYLIEGSTTRSTILSTSIPGGSGSSVSNVATLTFPWTDVSAVTDWSALKLKLLITAA
ncbi:PKD domain-containing protein [Jatrophihabitans telluris]|uniref:PKD domain-containing protein n=1 Tax=Jatrophihabitans telluris TaxID=2038343 RepID=A0ABY4R0C8_9ACTN|nr:PKD domain-containing protein [Jatrophihabitans telluris]UQX89204.1 PKD domain-containing protein [Jatrophihabitans telluris]